MSECALCPRLCRVDREKGERGICNQGDQVRIARAALHTFEEPSISGTRGSGTVFFCGCSLRCVFCQNQAISRSEKIGKVVSSEELCEIFLDLQAQGAHNINLVTPTHFAEGIRRALLLARDRLSIPVVYNTSGYERVETLKTFEGLIDVYMPDFKYASCELAEKYSKAPDYPDLAAAAIAEMYRQVGEYRLDGEGILLRGLLVRHLVLPGARKDSLAVLSRLVDTVDPKKILLSVMSQYTPEFAKESSHKELHRRITSFEYRSVVEYAEALGFDGYTQERSSAISDYTPDFYH